MNLSDHRMPRVNWRSFAVVGCVGIWLLISLVSLVAMYHLWWTRERVLYAGKSADAQRAIVIERAGIPPQTLEMAAQADAVWPLDVSYKANGSEVSLSYFKYLMIPRIPSGSETSLIQETGKQYVLKPDAGVPLSHRLFLTVDPTPRGLVLSALVLFAIAAGLSRFGFSIPEGVAGAALMLCAATVLLKPLFHSYWPIGMLMCALGALGAGIAWAKRKERTAVLSEDNAGMESSGGWIRWAAMAVLVGALIWAFLMAVVVVPDDWDAWAQWAPKAKLLALSTGALGDVKYFVPGSGDYPLLWPSVWAFSGWCAGGWEEQWSKGWGVLFLSLTAWQIKRHTQRVSGRSSAGWLFAALFASMPVVPLVASWGYAEPALWLLLVCAMSRLMQWRDSGDRRDLWLAGIFIAGAACTKNEGLLFAALSLAWVVVCRSKFRDLVAVSLPVLVAAGAWKAYCIFGMEASNHVVSSVASARPGLSQWVAMLAEAGRYVGEHWLDVKQWNVVLPGALMAASWTAAAGKRADRKNLILPFGMLLGLFMVVMTYGDNWRWQLGVAWNRLTIQFFVLLLPALAASCERPGQVLAPGSKD